MRIAGEILPFITNSFLMCLQMTLKANEHLVLLSLHLISKQNMIVELNHERVLSLFCQAFMGKLMMKKNTGHACT